VRGTDLRAAGGVPIGLGDLNITLGGNLVIEKQPGEEIVVLGEVRTVRGTYEFQGRQFHIERDGRVVLMGTEELNPRLDITATREISGVAATVHIGGVLREPELQLSSSPPMEDAEILSLIVFNQPLSLLGAGEQVSLLTRAAALASGFVASRLTESIGEALEIDVLEIETAAAAGAGLTPMLTVGEQFGRLFLKLQQRFGPEAVSRAVLEYRFAEWLRLQSAYAQGSVGTRQLLQRIEVGGIDLMFRFSY
jgi:translocation and assembly module TamB